MDLVHFHALLLEERQRFQDQIMMIGKTGLGDHSQGDQLEEDAHYDNHIADLGSEMFEREKDLGLHANAERRLKYVDIALERMAAGTYGTCIDCSSAIPEERLEVLPSAMTCIECQMMRDAAPDRFHRPVEEKVLTPPFGRSWRDGTGDPGYDGEDAWQDVGVYGTSETTADRPEAVKYQTELYHSEEDVQGIVDPMDAIVDDAGEPIHWDDRDREDDKQFDNAGTDTLMYGPDDMGGDFHWKPGKEYNEIKPERMTDGEFSNRNMPPIE